jgi:hypothetical protein
MKYCGTAGKPGSDRENKPYPKAENEGMIEGLNGTRVIGFKWWDK